MMASAFSEDELRQQLGQAYAHYSSKDVVRHLAVLHRCQNDRDVAIDALPMNDGGISVVICTEDRPGALATIAGLISAHRFEVVSGELFTLRIEREPQASRFPRWFLYHRTRGKLPTSIHKRTLALFELHSPRPRRQSFWHHFRDELASLLKLHRESEFRAVQEAILTRFSEALSESGKWATLTPVDVRVDNESHETCTVIHVGTSDVFGFFFEYSSGLEFLKLDVKQAVIATHEGRVCDTFWVTDLRGEKIRSDERINEIRVGTALIQQFSQLLLHSPNPTQAFHQFGQMIATLLTRPGWMQEVQKLESSEVLRTLAEVLGGSKFLWQDFLRIQHENLFPIVSQLPELDRSRSSHELRAELDRRRAESNSIAERVDELNRFKDREMFRADLRHITGRIGFAQFGNELSDLAEVVLGGASELTESLMEDRFGSPRLTAGDPCHWSGSVLGKLGGREMGFASDIEMIFVYEGHGTSDGPESIENTTYFERFVADFLRTPRAVRDGIFEIDLRLRPFGRAGNLACTLDIFRQYFSWEGQAEQYQRLALVKLRPIVGDSAFGSQVAAARDAFVYSKLPVDWGDINRMRELQCEQLVPPKAFSAKFSPGGLVDIEYFVQATQIEVGRDIVSVRQESTSCAIDALEAVHVFDASFAQRLRDSYRFWRLMIDALRCVRGNSHDLTIPMEQSSEFQYLARRLHMPSTEALSAQLESHSEFCRTLLFSPRTPRNVH